MRSSAQVGNIRGAQEHSAEHLILFPPHGLLSSVGRIRHTTTLVATVYVLRNV